MFLLTSPIIKQQIIQIAIVWEIISQSCRGSTIFFFSPLKVLQMERKQNCNLIYILENMFKSQQKSL